MFTFRSKQSLGQNFLIDDNIARNILRELHPVIDDVVVEIGPGRGALTKLLAGCVHHLVAVEIDGRVVTELREQFQPKNVTIIQQDFLTTSLLEIYKQFNKKLRLIGNIPYHLTSPILFKVFDDYSAIQDVTMMIQREVARRIVAKPNTKEYGILSVFTQYYGIPDLFFDVSPNCFYPKPKVTSTVLQIKLREKPTAFVNDKLFRLIVKTTFGKRRKTLRNSLAFLPFDKDIIRGIVDKVDFPLYLRPEQITIDDFVTLTTLIDKYLSLQ